MTDSKSASVQRRERYEAPRVREIGHVTHVTQKTGLGPDAQQTFKPGGGQG